MKHEPTYQTEAQRNKNMRERDEEFLRDIRTGRIAPSHSVRVIGHDELGFKTGRRIGPNGGKIVWNAVRPRCSTVERRIGRRLPLRPRRGLPPRRSGLRAGRPARRTTRRATASDPPGPSDPAPAAGALRSVCVGLETVLVSLLVGSATDAGYSVEKYAADIIAGWGGPAADLIDFMAVAAKASALVAA